MRPDDRANFFQPNASVLGRSLEVFENLGRVMSVDEIEQAIRTKFGEADCDSGLAHAQAVALKGMAVWIVRQRKKSNGCTKKARDWLLPLKQKVGEKLMVKKFTRKPEGSHMDTMETQLTGPVADAVPQAKESKQAASNKIPTVDQPACLEAVLRVLAKHPPVGFDPTAQHKKLFKNRLQAATTCEPSEGRGADASTPKAGGTSFANDQDPAASGPSLARKNHIDELHEDTLPYELAPGVNLPAPVEVSHAEVPPSGEAPVIDGQGQRCGKWRTRVKANLFQKGSANRTNPRRRRINQVAHFGRITMSSCEGLAVLAGHMRKQIKYGNCQLSAGQSLRT